MATHQIFDGTSWADFVGSMTFPMASTDIHFFHRGAGSFLQITKGATILKLFIAYPFSLNAEYLHGVMTLFVKNQGAEKYNPLEIDFSRSGTGLMIAPNGGGIGIADIRDGNYRLNSVVFDLKEVELNCVNKGNAQVKLSFDPSDKVVFPKA